MTKLHHLKIAIGGTFPCSANFATSNHSKLSFAKVLLSLSVQLNHRITRALNIHSIPTCPPTWHLHASRTWNNFSIVTHDTPNRSKRISHTFFLSVRFWLNWEKKMYHQQGGEKIVQEKYIAHIYKKDIIVSKALYQLCWGRLHEFCFSIPIYPKPNPLISCTSSDLFLLPPSMSSSAYHFPFVGHQLA